MRKTLGAIVAVALSATVSGCGSRVLVPPRIDLKEHEVIGVIDFDCPSEGELGYFATGRFVEAARRDQGIVRIVRLGSPAEALDSVGHARLDQAAFQALGEKHGVRTIIMGELIVSDVRPSVRVMQSLTRVGISADVHASLTVQMVETAGGASIWSRSADCTQEIAVASFSTNKQVVLGAGDPEKAYGRLIDSLVYAVTPEFRATWVRQ
jgi:hypothetical protein